MRTVLAVLRRIRYVHIQRKNGSFYDQRIYASNNERTREPGTIMQIPERYYLCQQTNNYRYTVL